MPITLASIIPAVGSIVGGLVDSFSTHRNVSKQSEHNLALADRQYGHQLDMWQKMNEYNAPAMQMKRFKEAGLNPNLIYGKGTAGNAQVA